MVTDPSSSTPVRTTRSGRAVKRPRVVYEPSDTSLEDDCDGESIGDEDTEEEESSEEEEDTDLSGFICPDGEGEEEEEEDEEDDEDEEDEDEEEDPSVVTRSNLSRKMMEFADSDDLDEAETLAAMVAQGYQFVFVDPKYQIKFVGYFKRHARPPLEMVREAFDLL